MTKTKEAWRSGKDKDDDREFFSRLSFLSLPPDPITRKWGETLKFEREDVVVRIYFFQQSFSDMVY